MKELPSKYRCPSCDKAVLNRRVSHCLYCSATLPQSFLFSPEKIVELDEEVRRREEGKKRDRPPQIAERSSVVRDVVEGIDIISDLGSIFD